MRILIVAHTFPPLTQGGAEIYAEQLASTLVRRFRDEVHVLTREQRPDRPEYTVRRETREGLRITWVNNTFRTIKSYEESYRCPAIAKIAAALIDEIQPDVVHIHHLTCLSTDIPQLLASRGVPVVFTLHDYWLLCHRGQLLDTSYRLCAGPGPAGCTSCLGAASTTVPASAVPALRAIDQRLPRALSSSARAVAAAWAQRRNEDPAARQRVEDMREACGPITRFLAPSRCIRDRFIRFGIPPERIDYWPYGFDLAWRREGSDPGSDQGSDPGSESGSEWGSDPGSESGSDPGSECGSGSGSHPGSEWGSDPGSEPRLRIGFLGTLMVSKAPHLLLEAFRRLPPGSASVDLFGAISDYHGDPSYADTLRPLLTLPDVQERGPQTREGVRAALASIDVLVVPSIWPDTSPLVIREAFLSGVPVIGSNIGGIPELIEHERNGLIFEPGDVHGLTLALRRLVDEPELLGRLKAGAAATPVRDREEDAAATRQLYESLVLQPGQVQGQIEGQIKGPTPGQVEGQIKGPTPGQVEGQTPPAPAASKHAKRRRLAAVVLNYRTAEDTAIAVASLLASDRPLDEVIVVDNDEGHECETAIARWADRLTYVRTGQNLGFSGGMNAGIRRALEGGADAVLLVNSDMVVPPDCVGRLEATIVDKAVGIVGPLIHSRSVPDVIGSVGIDYNLATGRMLHRRQGGADADVDAVSGCLMLIRRNVFERTGLLDERYFFAFEEIDFCLRARAKGFTARVVGDAIAYHEGGGAIGAGSSRRLYFAARNHLMLAGEHANGDGRVHRGARALFIAALNLAHAVRAPGGSLTDRVAATLRGIRDHLAGHAGDDRRA